jgi:hypothetical protein
MAQQLTADRIGSTAADNAFIHIADWQSAHDRYEALCRVPIGVFGQSYHSSLTQVEYATALLRRWGHSMPLRRP